MSNDEINLVNPGSNGGWKDVTGLAPNPGYNALVTFKGSGKYAAGGTPLERERTICCIVALSISSRAKSENFSIA